MTITDHEVRRIWREAGGSFHGPHVEHAYMEERKFLPFMRTLLSAHREAERSRIVALIEKVRNDDFIDFGVERPVVHISANAKEVCAALAEMIEKPDA